MGKIIQFNQIVNHLYIHIPFCQKKCKYCSFYSINYDKSTVCQYLNALKREIAFYKKQLKLDLQTIYFGGGTPSLLDSVEIGTILGELDFHAETEITLEANPNTLNKEKLQAYKDVGINRLSIGVQSFNDRILNYLGRTHDAIRALNVVDLAEDIGFENYSIDLIYGIPNQTKEDFLADIKKTISNKIPHISFYCLSLEEDVPLYSEVNKLPDDELICQQYYSAQNMLKESGYKQYEVSNFAKIGFSAQHNLAYWSGKTYLAVGPSAAGYLMHENSTDYLRYCNSPDLDSYLKTWSIDADFTLAEYELIDKKEQESEYIITRFRLNSGINLREYERLFDGSFLELYKKQIDRLTQLDLVAIDRESVIIKSDKLLLMNEILLEFI
ncbi:MAG TPA: radical SAM family heme chaperone HemW [Candidatus Cloacimonadota bacterium]|jgi:oxygen-independent coproporphyrinogen-3 oxidase|nr:radical SAM family heme chaperone HemW [Candidatus Cloacimonadales bacterium]HPY95932.1 radical SAM family heme chaperone HemW [Candidatus Cloacimonadota bacterium]HQB40887.1 radical SAM family heme chaperone HemW [Candidatus Cloacimonadota bacterium]